MEWVIRLLRRHDCLINVTLEGGVIFVCNSGSAYVHQILSFVKCYFLLVNLLLHITEESYHVTRGELTFKNYGVLVSKDGKNG